MLIWRLISFWIRFLDFILCVVIWKLEVWVGSGIIFDISCYWIEKSFVFVWFVIENDNDNCMYFILIISVGCWWVSRWLVGFMFYYNFIWIMLYLINYCWFDLRNWEKRVKGGREKWGREKRLEYKVEIR